MAAARKLTLYSATQVPHHIRRLVTEQLGVPESTLRLIAPDVGGGFGYKGKLYPEEAILAWAARRQFQLSWNWRHAAQDPGALPCCRAVRRRPDGAGRQGPGRCRASRTCTSR